MSSLAERLHKWSIQELNLVSEGGIGRIPKVESLSKLTKGKNKRIWNYVINHVRSQSYVDHVKRTLSLKKLLKDKEEAVSTVFWRDDSLDVVKLQASISKAEDKRKFLTQSLLAIEEKILTLEQKAKNIKNETFKINQKTTLLKHLKYLYSEKNANLKSLLIHVSSCKDALSSHQSTKACDKGVVVVPHNFLFHDDEIYDEHKSRVNDLVVLQCKIMKKLFNHEDDFDSLVEIFQNGVLALGNCNLLLSDFLILLKEMSDLDLSQLISLNLQSTSVKEFMLKKNEQNSVNILLTNLKREVILNTLKAKKCRRLSAVKENVIANKMGEMGQSLSDTGFKLLQTLAENNSLNASNGYLEEFLGEMRTKTDAVYKSIRQNKLLCSEDLGSLVQKLFAEVDLTFYLRYTAPSAIDRTLDEWNKLTYYMCNELFKKPFPSKECLRKLRTDFASERKRTWDYCNRINLVESPFSGPLADHSLPADVYASLNFRPFQNVGALCENWLRLKRKLFADSVDSGNSFTRSSAVDVSETNAKIHQMLERMKFSTEKGTLFVNDGVTCCHRAKFLVQEWWDQDAQYIPNIVHEGKTLKMWTAILAILTNFELQRYS